MADPIQISAAWKDGQWLVLRRDSPVGPDRCIVTNEPTFGHRRFQRTLSWGKNGPGDAWIPMKIQVLWALADMKFVRVEVGLREKVKAKRLIRLVLSFASMAGGLALFVYGIQKGFPPSMTHLGGGATLTVIALTLFANTHSVIDIVAMDDEHIWLRGAHRVFLDTLPEFPK
ncbi:MAG: hypothetical protein IPL39_10200 [Opitutaceae bacterium]|nr:hypothetical protein [Opitutaceae bacterium]